MFKIQSHVPVPKLRRSHGSPTASEQGMIDGFMRAYRLTHGCALTLGAFDIESRVQVFHGPAITLAHTPRRCKELTKQLKFRRN